MMFDRKRINRLARWFAIIMAIIFALGTVLLGVGSGTGNILAGCTGSSSNGPDSSDPEDVEAFYKEQLEFNPVDAASMLALARLYASDRFNRFDDAINYYNQYLALNPTDADAFMLLGQAQMSKGDFAGAVTTYAQVTQIRPTDSFAFLQLGLAGKNAGQNQTAILAWSKWLELNPNDSNAPAIKEEIARLQTLPAVTPLETATTPQAGVLPTPAPAP